MSVGSVAVPLQNSLYVCCYVSKLASQFMFIVVHLFVAVRLLDLLVIESRKGISPLRSHGTVLETLASHSLSRILSGALIVQSRM